MIEPVILHNPACLFSLTFIWRSCLKRGQEFYSGKLGWTQVAGYWIFKESENRFVIQMDTSPIQSQVQHLEK